MDQLRVTLVQFDISWEQSAQNIKQLNQLLEPLNLGQTDLILLPETFSSGFTNAAASVAQSMEGEVVSWMKQQAKLKEAVIAGTVIVTADDHFYNRFVFAYPNGQLVTYDKRHLFSLAGEHEHYTAGKDRKVLDIKGWKVFPQICYDLRFPVWSRNDLGYDLAVYVANWPNARKEAWRSLLLARAIENQAYVVGVNRVGQDANGLEYSGHSVGVDYTGERIMELDDTTRLQTITLHKEPMTNFRSKLAFLNDQDKFSIQL